MYKMADEEPTIGGLISLREEIEELNQTPIQDQDIDVEISPKSVQSSDMFDINQ